MAAAAEQAEAEALLEGICRDVGVGLRALQGRERTPETAKRRAVVAWILRERLHWAPADVARALQRTPRQVRNMLAAERR
jgi:hypothetical protein